MNMILYKTIGYIVLALIIIGIAIPKLTVRDTVQLTDKEKSCVQTSIKQQLDHPLQRLALALGKSAVVEKQGDGIIKPNTMIVKSYTIFRIPLPVTRLFNQFTQHVICDWASEKVPTDNIAVPGLGKYRETSVMDGMKAYQSARFSVFFYYPKKYLLFESRGEGFGGVEYYVVSLVPDSKYIREAMTGVQREDSGGLPSIHFSFYHQPDHTLSLEEWVRTKLLSSNFDSSNPEPTFTSATVAGVHAVSYYDVSGLYTRDTFVFSYDEWVVKAAADDDNFKTDFEAILESMHIVN